MSLIMVGSDVDGMLDVYCDLCHKSVGLMTVQEIGELACADTRIWCFDCDFACADVVPTQLVMADDEYFVGIGEALFLCEWASDSFLPGVKELRFKLVLLWLGLYGVGEEVRGVEESLSSSTYQHKNHVSGGVEL